MVDVMDDMMPTFVDADESQVIAKGEYRALITGGAIEKSKNPSKELTDKYGTEAHNWNLRPDFKIITATTGDVRCANWTCRAWFSMLGKFAWKVQRLLAQAGIQKYYDPTHPEFVQTQKPDFTGLSDEDRWARIGAFYFNGEMDDAQGNHFSCPDGGLIGKTVLISVGDPQGKDGKGIKDERLQREAASRGELRTGSITPMRVS